MMKDLVSHLAANIAAAAANNTPLCLQGGGSKQFYGNPPHGELLDLSALDKIVAYEPSELYISAGAGAPLATIESMLADNGQMLAFEPPHFGAATAGGALACGLSGPRRPAAGALRDHVLGVSIINGRGEILRFGGTVLKNVAGFDVSRLMAGALGTLGVITEVVFRVSPAPETELSTITECTAAEGLAATHRLLSAGVPIISAAWHGGLLWRRFAGGEASLRRALQEAGGEPQEPMAAADFWRSVREHTHDFFGGDDNLWRIAAPSLSPLAAGDDFIEWHGAVRWRRGDRDAALHSATQAGGAATLFRARSAQQKGRFPPLSGALAKIHRNLKQAFDPEDILNRGRLYDFPAA